MELVSSEKGETTWMGEMEETYLKGPWVKATCEALFIVGDVPVETY